MTSTKLSPLLVFVCALAVACAPTPPDPPQQSQQDRFGLVIHGGAGRITGETVDDDKEKAIREKLDEVVRLGHRLLAEGASSLEVVEGVIVKLEDSPLFNAGRGAVFTAEGINELDASIMDGSTMNSGAVAGVVGIRNPIRLARLVMTESPHVMMTSDGARAFAELKGLETAEPEWFRTEERWRALQEKLEETDKLGTVGCVALDLDGNLAAGTSTGGMTGKRFGRVGDSPIIGAGTYADNRSCAVSCTGHGEYFIRYVVAHDISARMKYLGETLAEAGRAVIRERLVEAGGRGGAIAIDRHGNVTAPFNTEGMYRAWMVESGEPVVAVFGDDPS